MKCEIFNVNIFLVWKSVFDLFFLNHLRIKIDIYF